MAENWCPYLQTPKDHSDLVKAVALSPDGKTLVSVSNPSVKLWDVGSGKSLQMLEGHCGRSI
ncbi:hypothetical protein J1614_004313 [Plenodomus biglobosus]|nr:hypothetical protein J1614_004313 [Plenodomus biglobosus]